MSAEKLHAVTGALDAWEVARTCLWHRINELLATKGTARLREKRGARAPLPKPPAGVTLAGALSALRVAARGLALHLDVSDSFPWLVLGNCPLTLNGSPTAGSVEYDLQRAFTGKAADHADAEFWQREIVEATMKHAEEMRAELRAEQAKAAARIEATATRGCPGRRGYPREALAYAQRLRRDNPDMKASTLRAKCLEKFDKDDLPPNGEAFRRWLNRPRKNRAN